MKEVLGEYGHELLCGNHTHLNILLLEEIVDAGVVEIQQAADAIQCQYCVGKLFLVVNHSLHQYLHFMRAYLRHMLFHEKVEISIAFACLTMLVMKQSER